MKLYRVLVFIIFFLLFLSSSITSYSSEAYSDMCVSAIETQERKDLIPKDLLLAISKTESGKTVNGKYGPWPWTINYEGKGLWFASKKEAVEYVENLLSKGIRSIDIGCMQVNLYWHDDAFTSIEDAFDPVKNVEYASSFLKELFKETKSWYKSYGYYHSRDSEKANKYRKYVMANWKDDKSIKDDDRNINHPIEYNGTITAFQNFSQKFGFKPNRKNVVNTSETSSELKSKKVKKDTSFPKEFVEKMSR